MQHHDGVTFESCSNAGHEGEGAAVGRKRRMLVMVKFFRSRQPPFGAVLYRDQKDSLRIGWCGGPGERKVSTVRGPRDPTAAPGGFGDQLSRRATGGRNEIDPGSFPTHPFKR